MDPAATLLFAGECLEKAGETAPQLSQHAVSAMNVWASKWISTLPRSGMIHEISYLITYPVVAAMIA